MPNARRWVLLTMLLLTTAACGKVLAQDDAGAGDDDDAGITTYALGGTVSGLAGEGLVLRNDGGDDLAISSSGAFTFPDELAAGSSYAVTVGQQPSGQTCTVSNGSGTANADVDDIAVTCVTLTYTIGGNVTGLRGSGLVLRSGAETLSIETDGAFRFAGEVPDNTGYEVLVETHPVNQACTIRSGTGTISGADVSDVAVDCANIALTTVCSLPSTSGIFCGGNCTSNHDEYASWYCQLAGFTGALSFDVLTEGVVDCLYYNASTAPVLSDCSQVIGPTGYGLDANCDAVTNLICF